MVTLSPAVNARAVAHCTFPKNVPAVDAVHNEPHDHVSDVDTAVQVVAAVFEIAPDAAADPNVNC
jgi:hypothetical protein